MCPVPLDSYLHPGQLHLNGSYLYLQSFSEAGGLLGATAAALLCVLTRLLCGSQFCVGALRLSMPLRPSAPFGPSCELGAASPSLSLARGNSIISEMGMMVLLLALPPCDAAAAAAAAATDSVPTPLAKEDCGLLVGR